ncbi:MAG: GNAT family N-acetyltransferase [Pseudomonadota bacterium]
MGIEICEADERDAEVISALNVDVQKLHSEVHPWRFKEPGPDTFPAHAAAEFIAKPNHFAFLAYDEGEAKGYVVAEIREYPESSKVRSHSMVYVHHISVRPSAQRRGIGQALLAAVKARGEESGITLLALDTWSFNDQALTFFKKCGLVPYNIRLWNKTD